MAKATVVHIQHPLPFHFTQARATVAVLVDIIVQQSRNHIVGRSNRMEVSGKMEVDVFHRKNLRITTTSRPAFHTEAGTQRRLAQGHNGFLANLIHTQSQANRHRGLTDTGLVGSDSSHQNQMVFLDFLFINLGEIHLGNMMPVVENMFRVDADHLSNFFNLFERGLPRDFNICFHLF